MNKFAIFAKIFCLRINRRLSNMVTKRFRYNSPLNSAIKRLGSAEKAALASWNKASASLEDALSKLSLRSSALKVSTRQAPSSRTIGTGKASAKTITRPLSRSTETIISPTSAENIRAPKLSVNLAKTLMVANNGGQGYNVEHESKEPTNRFKQLKLSWSACIYRPKTG